MSALLRRIVLPDHTFTANPFLPEGDSGGNSGGAGGNSGGEGGAGGNSGAGTGGQGGDKQGEGGTDWKSHARTWESRAAAEAKEKDGLKAELEKLRKERMSDSEKAVEQAKAEGRKEGESAAMTKAAEKLVGAEARAALAGRGLEKKDLDELVADAKVLPRLRTADGEPDEAAITAWADRVAPKGQQQASGLQRLGQGRREHADRPTSMNEAIRAGARR